MKFRKTTAKPVLRSTLHSGQCCLVSYRWREVACPLNYRSGDSPRENHFCRKFIFNSEVDYVTFCGSESFFFDGSKVSFIQMCPWLNVIENNPWNLVCINVNKIPNTGSYLTTGDHVKRRACDVMSITIVLYRCFDVTK